jgi:hypothetical protein
MSISFILKYSVRLEFLIFIQETNSSMPLILKDTVEPMDGIMKQQDKVVAYWEKDCLGQGSLFLTEKFT